MTWKNSEGLFNGYLSSMIFVGSFIDIMSIYVFKMYSSFALQPTFLCSLAFSI